MLEVVATYNPAIGASSLGSASAESRESKGFAKWLIAHLSPEEQISACLLCASATCMLPKRSKRHVVETGKPAALWLNPLPGTPSKKVYHRVAEAQRRRTERRGGRGI